MGEIDSEDEEIVDEKLWGSEDEEEDNTRRDGKEKINRNDSVEAQPEGESEMVAKEGEDGQDSQEEDENNDKNPPEGRENNQQNEDEEHGSEEPEPEDEEEDEVNDMEDIYDDRGKEPRKEEDFELPNNLDLDRDIGEQSEQEEEEEEENGEATHDDNVLDVSGDEQDGADKEEEDSQEDQQTNEHKDQEDQQERTESNEDEQKQDKKELDTEGDEEKHAGLGGQEAKEEEEEEEDAIDKSNAQSIEEKDKEEVNVADTQPQGAMHETVRKSADVRMDERQYEESRPPEDVNNSDDTTQEVQIRQPDERSQRWIKTMNESVPPERPEGQKRKRTDPNPYRSEGDASREWKERLNTREGSTTEERENDEERDAGLNEKEAELYEFLEDEEHKEDTQTLAPVDENQAKALPQKEDQEEKVQQQNEETAEDKMDEDEGEREENSNSEGDIAKPKGARELHPLPMAKDRGQRTEEDKEDPSGELQEEEPQTEDRMKYSGEGVDSFYSLPTVDEDTSSAQPADEGAQKIDLLTPEEMQARREDIER